MRGRRSAAGSRGRRSTGSASARGAAPPRRAPCPASALGLADVLDDRVVKADEQQVQLRDDEVLVVARVADQRPPLRVSRQVDSAASVSAERDRVAPTSSFTPRLGPSSRTGTAGPRARAVQRVEVQARRAEVHERLRVVGRARARRRVERDVVIDELPEVRVARRGCTGLWGPQRATSSRPVREAKDQVVDLVGSSPDRRRHGGDTRASGRQRQRLVLGRDRGANIRPKRPPRDRRAPTARLGEPWRAGTRLGALGRLSIGMPASLEPLLDCGRLEPLQGPAERTAAPAPDSIPADRALHSRAVDSVPISTTVTGCERLAPPGRRAGSSTRSAACPEATSSGRGAWRSLLDQR